MSTFDFVELKAEPFEFIGRDDVENEHVVDDVLTFAVDMPEKQVGFSHKLGPQQVVTWTNPLAYAEHKGPPVVMQCADDFDESGTLTVVAMEKTVNMVFSRSVETVVWAGFHVHESCTLLPELLVLLIDHKSRHWLVSIKWWLPETPSNVARISNMTGPSLRKTHVVSLLPDCVTYAFMGSQVFSFPSGEFVTDEKILNKHHELLGAPCGGVDHIHWVMDSPEDEHRQILPTVDDGILMVTLGDEFLKVCLNKDVVVDVCVPEGVRRLQGKPLFVLHPGGSLTVTFLSHDGKLNCFGVRLPDSGIQPVQMCC